jgi:hypothetical protein
MSKSTTELLLTMLYYASSADVQLAAAAKRPALAILTNSVSETTVPLGPAALPTSLLQSTTPAILTAESV